MDTWGDLAMVLTGGVVAGFVGAITGGGGLLVIPLLIFVGLPPTVAIATTKLGGVGAGIGSLVRFWKFRHIRWEFVGPFALMSLAGGVLGGRLLLAVDERTLTIIVGVVLFCFIPLLFGSRARGTRVRRTTRLQQGIGYLSYFLLMVYVGFFGGGAGTLIFLILVLCFGFTMIQAIATDVIPWLLVSTSSLVILVTGGVVDYPVGIVLFLGTLLGGYLAPPSPGENCGSRGSSRLRSASLP